MPYKNLTSDCFYKTIVFLFIDLQFFTSNMKYKKKKI